MLPPSKAHPHAPAYMRAVTSTSAEKSKCTAWAGEKGTVDNARRARALVTDASAPHAPPTHCPMATPSVSDRGGGCGRTPLSRHTTSTYTAPASANQLGEAPCWKQRDSVEASDGASATSGLSLGVTQNSFITKAAGSLRVAGSLLSSFASHAPQTVSEEEEEELGGSASAVRRQPAMHGYIRTIPAGPGLARPVEGVAAAGDSRKTSAVANLAVTVTVASESVNGVTSPSPSPSLVNGAAPQCGGGGGGMLGGSPLVKPVRAPRRMERTATMTATPLASTARTRALGDVTELFSPPPPRRVQVPRTRPVTVTNPTTAAAAAAALAKARKASETKQQQQQMKVRSLVVAAVPTPPPVEFATYVSSRSVLQDFLSLWRNRYEENKACYREGGYLHVVPGKILRERFVMIQKLGWGEFSTVWLAYDTRHATRGRGPAQAFVAVKIAKCGTLVRQSSIYEVGLLRYLNARLRATAPVTNLIDSFEVAGEFGVHLCMVMPVHGSNLLAVIDQFRARPAVRTAPERLLIKECLLSILTGLQELHAVHVIHTDIKPENVLANLPDPRVMATMERFCARNSHRSGVISPEELREHMFGVHPRRSGLCAREGPEADRDNPAPPSGPVHRAGPIHPISSSQHHLVCLADFGLGAVLEPPTISPETEAALAEGAATTAAGVTDPGEVRRLLLQLVTSKKEFPVSQAGTVRNRAGVLLQTREYRAPEVLLGLDLTTATDMWSVGCMAYEMITGEFLLDPKKRFKGQPRTSSVERQMDVEHMAMIGQLIGPMPRSITSLRTEFNAYYEECAGNPRALPGHLAPAGSPVRRPPAYIHRYVDAQGAFLYSDCYPAPDYPARDLAEELTPFLGRTEAAEAASFIMQCLSCYDPRERPGARAMLRHPWLASVGRDSRFTSEP